jgi:hypothetical protein
VLEVKRLADDYDAPDVRPVLILAAAPSAKTHAAPRSPYVRTSSSLSLRRACADTFFIQRPRHSQRCKRDPILLRFSCTSATASTRSSAPDTLGTIRTTSYPSPPPCVSATPTARSSPLIGASCLLLMSPALSASVLADYKIQGVYTWSHEAADACARRRVHHG